MPVSQHSNPVASPAETAQQSSRDARSRALACESHTWPPAPVRKNKVRVMISIHPDLLVAMDLFAQHKGLSRAGAISLACAELLKREQEAAT